jgi:large repetitive protein
MSKSLVHVGAPPSIVKPHDAQPGGSRSRHRIVAAAVALGLAGAVAPASSAAAPTETVTCGEVIAHSVVIANDLACGFGQTVLTVGADSITIDLGGHKLQGIFAPALSSSGHRFVTIENGILGDNANALTLTGDHHDTVRNVEADGGGEGAGVSLSGGSHNSVIDSTLSSAPECCAPLELSQENGDVIDGNTAVGSNGIQIGPGLGNRVTHNTTPRIDVSGASDLIKRNTIAPISLPLAPGLTIEGNDNLVVANDVSGSAEVAGQLVQFPEGINVTGSGNVLSGNVANNSLGDGIHVLTAGNTLGANVANGNGALGIEAVPGVVDAGQNQAGANGNPAECLNIACSASSAPPAPMVTAHRARISTRTRATFRFTDSQPGVGFECRLDGGAFSDCSSPWRYHGLQIGQHAFQVHAIDSLGQTSADTSYEWTVTAIR